MAMAITWAEAIAAVIWDGRADGIAAGARVTTGIASKLRHLRRP